jgi:hypothetical protein
VADYPVTTGSDTWVSEASPASVNPSGRFPALKGGSGDRFYTLLHMPLSMARIGGRTILSATLSVPVQGNWVAQTVTIQALAAKYGVANVNWNNKPGVLGATAATATGALTAGQRFELDVTALVQAVANGQDNFGWRLTTSQSTDRSTIRGFESGYSPWTLDIEVSDAPPTPDQLSPAGVISIAKPVLQVDDTDDLAQIQVQVDASASSPFDYDSGWVATTEPLLDLAAITANALPASQGNAGTFDTDISGWLTSNCAIARVTTPTQQGAGALRMTASTAASMFAASSNSTSEMVPVVPGQTIHVDAYSRAATTGRSTRVEIQWYDSAGVALSVTVGTSTANDSTSWGLREMSADAPAGAAYMRPRLFVASPASGEIHYWDTVTVNTGTSNYAGLADAATTNWRARVKTTDGSTSAWSSWVEITRHVKPSMVMDNPSGTDLWDPTPTIAAHLSPAGNADTRWQVIVTDDADPTAVRYNSGDAVEGATLAHEIPLRWNGRKVFPTEGDYRLVVKAWDRTDRVPSQGDNPFVRTVTIVTLDVDGTQTPVTTLTASQATSGYPDIKLHWTRASDPDRFIIVRDGEVLARVDPDDVRVSAGVFEWVDESAAPNVQHTYHVRASTDVGGGVVKQSANGPAAVIFAEVTGVWLRWAAGDVLLYSKTPPDARQVDKRETFDLPYRAEPVDIITAVGGFEGSFAGSIDRRQDDLDATRALLEGLRQKQATPVRLVWSSRNIWARLRGLSVAPREGTIVRTNQVDAVTFGFYEIDPQD